MGGTIRPSVVKEYRKSFRDFGKTLAAVQLAERRLGAPKEPNPEAIARAQLEATVRVATALEGMYDVYRSQVSLRRACASLASHPLIALLTLHAVRVGAGGVCYATLISTTTGYGLLSSLCLDFYPIHFTSSKRNISDEFAIIIEFRLLIPFITHHQREILATCTYTQMILLSIIVK